MRRIMGARLRGDRRGQALVEFALLAPILLLIIVGLIEFGRAWQAYQVVTDAAREGARIAAVADPTVTTDTVADRINRQLARSALDSASAVKTVQVNGVAANPGAAATGDVIFVEIRYPYRFVFLRPFMGWTGANAQISLNAGSVMRKE